MRFTGPRRVAQVAVVVPRLNILSVNGLMKLSKYLSVHIPEFLYTLSIGIGSRKAFVG